jgi:hypothetical protein
MPVVNRALASSIPTTRRIAQLDGGSVWPFMYPSISQSRNPADLSP